MHSLTNNLKSILQFNTESSSLCSNRRAFSILSVRVISNIHRSPPVDSHNWTSSFALIGHPNNLSFTRPGSSRYGASRYRSPQCIIDKPGLLPPIFRILVAKLGAGPDFLSDPYIRAGSRKKIILRLVHRFIPLAHQFAGIDQGCTWVYKGHEHWNKQDTLEGFGDQFEVLQEIDNNRPDEQIFASEFRQSFSAYIFSLVHPSIDFWNQSSPTQCCDAGQIQLANFRESCVCFFFEHRV